jgi:hypothetical protein
MLFFLLLQKFTKMRGCAIVHEGGVNTCLKLWKVIIFCGAEVHNTGNFICKETLANL